MRKECPHSDQRQARKVGEQQGRHRRSAIDESVKEAVTRFDVAPWGFEVPNPTQSDHAGQNCRRSDRKIQRNVLRGFLEMIHRVSDVDVRGENRKIRGDKKLGPKLRVVYPLKMCVAKDTLQSEQQLTCGHALSPQSVGIMLKFNRLRQQLVIPMPLYKISTPHERTMF